MFLAAFLTCAWLHTLDWLGLHKLHILLKENIYFFIPSSLFAIVAKLNHSAATCGMLVGNLKGLSVADSSPSFYHLISKYLHISYLST